MTFIPSDQIDSFTASPRQSAKFTKMYGLPVLSRPRLAFLDVTDELYAIADQLHALPIRPWTPRTSSPMPSQCAQPTSALCHRRSSRSEAQSGSVVEPVILRGGDR